MFQQWLLDLFEGRISASQLPPVPLFDGQTMRSYLARLTQAGEDMCSRDRAVQPHQAVVQMMAALRARGLIQTPGLLAVHSTGAGKTAIGVSCMLQFWNVLGPKRQPYGILLISTPTNQSSNNTLVLAREAVALYPDFEDLVTGEQPAQPFARQPGETDQQVLERAQARIVRRLEMGYETIITAPSDKDRLRHLRLRRDDGQYMYTFGKFGRDIAHGLVGTRHFVAILDEVQFVTSPPATDVANKDYYDRVQLFLSTQRDPATTWCVGMTATPGETKAELCDVLNMISAGKPRFDPAKPLGAGLAGLVSYANLAGDLSHFASFDVHTQCVQLSRRGPYYRKYMRLLYTLPLFRAEVLAEHPELSEVRVGAPKRYNPDEPGAEWVYDPEARHRYYKTLVDAANFRIERVVAPPQMQEGGVALRDRGQMRGRDAWDPKVLKPGDALDSDEESVDVGEGSASNAALLVGSKDRPTVHSFQVRDGSGLSELFVSPKLLRVAQNAASLPGKHYIYTHSRMSALVLAHLLATKHKMQMYYPTLDPEAIQAMDKARAEEEAQMLRRSGVPSFIMLDDVSSEREPLRQYGYKARYNRMRREAAPGQVRGKGSLMVKERINWCKLVANTDANMNGKAIKVVIATKESFKGVDMRHITGIHMVNPLTDYSDFLQLCGRGPRFCSHAGLRKRQVNLYVYRLLLPGEGDSADCVRHAGQDLRCKALADCWVWNESRQRYRQNWKVLQDQLKKYAVDHLLFRDNIHRAEAALEDKLDALVCAPALGSKQGILLEEQMWAEPKKRKVAIAKVVEDRELPRVGPVNARANRLARMRRMDERRGRQPRREVSQQRAELAARLAVAAPPAKQPLCAEGKVMNLLTGRCVDALKQQHRVEKEAAKALRQQNRAAAKAQKEAAKAQKEDAAKERKERNKLVKDQRAAVLRAQAEAIAAEINAQFRGQKSPTVQTEKKQENEKLLKRRKQSEQRAALRAKAEAIAAEIDAQFRGQKAREPKMH